MVSPERAIVRIPVLLYHAISATPSPGTEPWTASPQRFQEHLEAIAGSGRVAVTISELGAYLGGSRAPVGDLLAVTFDDGYADTPGAVRALLSLGIGSTVFVTTGSVGMPGRLSRADVEGLAALDGVEVGAHGVSHRYLDELPRAELDDEIAGSRRALEDILGRPVRSFAYPHGAHDRHVRDAVIRAGFRTAVAVKDAISHLEDDPFAIARWTVMADSTRERVAGILRGDGAPLAWEGERFRTRAYRAVRRARRALRAATVGRVDK